MVIVGLKWMARDNVYSHISQVYDLRIVIGLRTLLVNRYIAQVDLDITDFCTIYMFNVKEVSRKYFHSIFFFIIV